MNEIVKDKIILNSVNPLDIYGPKNCNINLIKSHFQDLSITPRGTQIFLKGKKNDVDGFKQVFSDILNYLKKNQIIESQDVEQLLNKGFNETNLSFDFFLSANNGNVIKPKTISQREMVMLSQKNNLLFTVGPAGTGKTYIAVALAVRALRNKEVKKVILTRPAVEAGENLGFLPGDLYDKLSPYMRPLYDSLNDMVSKEKLNLYIEKNQIEIVPLAFMRGRTLDKAFVILDEAQNTTINQMQMFLTRMGPESKFIVCGDVSQVDLPKTQKSGLIHATKILKSLDGIGLVKFNEKDVIRHQLVKSIIKAYKK